MNRILLAAALALAMTGCTTKNYVRNQTTPLINKTNELDDLTAQTTRNAHDLDARVQQGLADVNSRSDAANQKALAAGQQADQAQSLASQASTGVNALTNQVANLDNYHTVTDAVVHFGFNRDNLTPKAKAALDEFAAEIPNAQHWILAIDGNTDSVGSKEYNYSLSKRRASAVIQYLAEKHNIPAHKIYVVGLGKDKPVASNASTKGRSENRRVDVKLMTNLVEAPAAAQNTAPVTPQQQ
jgi:outer membrane protein OmpA-like peptidoglycan-associated protein